MIFFTVRLSEKKGKEFAQIWPEEVKFLWKLYKIIPYLVKMYSYIPFNFDLFMHDNRIVTILGDIQ